jgi:hypothetical protein
MTKREYNASTLEVDLEGSFYTLKLHDSVHEYERI